MGVENPRPSAHAIPTEPFEIVRLRSNKNIHCWLISAAQARGTIVMFHGYKGEKSSLLRKSAIFRALGYHTLLVDFMGSGESEGDQTTIGYWEAEQVKTCFEYLQQRGEKNIILWGTSMGAVAAMRARAVYPQVQPSCIILECPFGTMRKTVAARCHLMGIPAFPAADLLVFWGGIENNFWGFSHNPITYAAQIDCPTLLLYGAKDNRVSAAETNAIFSRLSGHKTLRVYTNAGHEDYLGEYAAEWESDVRYFLAQYAQALK